MDIKKCRSWNGFINAINDVRKQYGMHRTTLTNGDVIEKKNEIFFRGESDSSWHLETTLERKTDDIYYICKYMEKVCRGVSEIESFSGKNWHINDFPAILREIKDKQEPAHIYLPAYDYLVYLRHHGFPSPLLDWTESPFIAAYFAYLSQKEKKRAVYCYIPNPDRTRITSVGKPQITVKGPYVRTHTRHFAQKAWYTIATKWDTSEERHYFVPHETIFDRGTTTQDVLVKIELPASLRKIVLENLNDYNINHLALFQDEEALVKTVELKVFDLCS